MKTLIIVLNLTMSSYHNPGENLFIESFSFALNEVLCAQAVSKHGSKEASLHATCTAYCTQGRFWLSDADLDSFVKVGTAKASVGFCKAINEGRFTEVTK